MKEERYMEVGRLEIGLKGAMKKENRFVVNQRLREHGAHIFSSKEHGEIFKLDRSKLIRYSYNFNCLKRDIRALIPKS